MLATLTACALGFVSGLRHALEPDHVTAVTTFVAGQKSVRASIRYAVAWGCGHAIMLLLAAGALALLRRELPPRVGDILELFVAASLVALGARGLFLAAKPAKKTAPSSGLPFIVGLVHGLAGSGALAALVASHVPSALFAVAFIAIYAVGAAVGMATLAGTMGWPLARVTRNARAMTVVIGGAAVASLALGIVWAAPIVMRLAS